MSNQNFGHIDKTNNKTYRTFWMDHGILKSKTFKNNPDAILHLERMKHRSGDVDYFIDYDNYYKLIEPSIYTDLSARTIADHKYYWKKISSCAGKIQVSKTTWWLIQEIVDQIDGTEAQRKVYNLLKKILNYAVRDELIQRNPCDKLIKLKKPLHKEKVLWTKQELEYMLNYINGTKYALPVLLECICGLRHEEYCGLDINDVNYENYGTDIHITINKAVTSVGGHKIIKETKNKYSNRTIVLNKNYFQYFITNMYVLNESKDITDYISPSVLTKNFRMFCRKNSLKYMPFESMRSLYATLCSEAGCIDSVVSLSMGHYGNTAKQSCYQQLSITAISNNACTLAEYLNLKLTPLISAK